MPENTRRTAPIRRFPAYLLLAACSASSRPAEPPPNEIPRSSVVPIIVETSDSPRVSLMTRREPIVETLYGEKIADPYRWLEHSDDSEVQRWVLEENQITESVLARISGRKALRERLEELLAIGELSLPSVRRSGAGQLRYFFTRRDGNANQPRLFVREKLDGAERVLLDPNTLSADGTTSLDWYMPSQDGSLLAYGLSEGGSEESTLRIREVATAKDLPDQISRARSSSVCWLPGSKRFYYSRFPAPGSVPPSEEKYHRTIYQHVLGAAPDTDAEVFRSGDMTDFPSCVISPGGRWLVIRVHQGWSKSSLWIGDTHKKPLSLREVTKNLEHVYDPLPLDDSIYIRTNEGASRYQLYELDPRHPEREHWKRILPEHPEDVLGDVTAVDGELLVSYLHGVVTRLERFDRQGRSKGGVELPTFGSSTGFSGLHDDTQAFFDFESFAVPPTIRRIDLKTGKVSLWQEVKANSIAADQYAVTPGSAKSRDGTEVPYLIVHKKSIDLQSGNNPTLLYGYGGFNVSLLPRFSRSTYAFLEKGGVYVQANLRGGGEFGEDWHRAGQLEKKQNVFDDFIAIAEKLVASKLTRPERLAIHGRSNGGLLVAVALTQRPDLFRAVVSGVPLTDMLRYHHFQIARLWIPEYGTPEDPQQFKVLHAYSPYHHVKPGGRYPAVLMMTAESDTRVDPMHARKMAAMLQYASSSGLPVLLRSEIKAGHGAGKPIAKIAEEYADIYAFLMWQLGMFPEQ